MSAEIAQAEQSARRHSPGTIALVAAEAACAASVVVSALYLGHNVMSAEAFEDRAAAVQKQLAPAWADLTNIQTAPDTNKKQEAIARTRIADLTADQQGIQVDLRSIFDQSVLGSLTGAAFLGTTAFLDIQRIKRKRGRTDQANVIRPTFHW